MRGDIMNHLFQVAYEAFGAAALIPFATEPTLASLHAFGTPMFNPLLVALGGAAGSLSLSWCIGFFLSRRQLAGKFRIDPEQYGRFTHAMRKYGWLIVPFSFWSIGGLFPVLAGFGRLPFWPTLALALIGRAMYYAMQFS